MATLNDLFYNKYESLASNHTEFVAMAYEDLLGYDVDNMKNADARIGYWVDRIENGLSRDDFAGTFVSESDGGESQWVSDADLEKNAASKAAVLELNFDDPDLDLSKVREAVQEAHGGAGNGDTGNGDTGNGDTGNGDTIESSGTFTLTEIPSETEVTLTWSEIDADRALDFFRDVADLDLIEEGLVNEDGSANFTDINLSDSSVTFSTGEGTEYLEVGPNAANLVLLAGMVFDFDNGSGGGDMHLEEDELTTYEGIVLTPSVNNGGAIESGTTGIGDNTIVAGRPELLHGAYIDGGDGENTLQVNMKGFFAQPFQLLNIQNVEIQNAPNIYSANETLPVDGNGDLLGVAEFNVPLPSEELTGEDSVLDLTRAESLETLTINENAFTLDSNNEVGDLTVAGINNGVTATLTDSISQNITLHYGFGGGAQVNVDLVDVNYHDGELRVAHNSPTVTLNSLGEGSENYIENGAFDDHNGLLRQFNVTGDTFLNIDSDIEFQDGRPATINASENTGGVKLQTNHGDDVVVFGSQGNDEILLSGANDNVVITGGEGQNQYTASGGAENLTFTGAGQDQLVIAANSTTDEYLNANIDMGVGPNVLDMDVDNSDITLLAGSTIAGEDITLVVQADAAATTNNSLDITEADVSGVTGVALADGATVVVNQAQFQALGADAFQTTLPDEDGTVSLLIDEQGVQLGDLNIDQLGDGVSLALGLEDGATLELTAEEWAELQEAGIAITDESGTGEPGTVNISGVTNAQSDIDVSGIAVAIQGTITFAEDVALADDADLGNVSTLTDPSQFTDDNGFNIDLAEGQTLTLANAGQAHGLNVDGAENARVVFDFETLNIPDSNPAANTQVNFGGTSGTIQDGIFVGNYENIDEIEIYNTLLSQLSDNNIDQLLAAIDGDTDKLIVKGEGNGIEQTITLAAGVTQNGGVVVEDIFETPDALQRDVTVANINLQGGTTIAGDLDFSSTQGGSGLTFQTLNLLSTGDEANAIAGEILATSNDLLDVNITAESDLNVDVDGTDGIVLSSTTADASAAVNVTTSNGSVVTLGQIDSTDTDVDTVNISHNGDGQLVVPGNSAGADLVGTEALNLTGDADMTFGDAEATPLKPGVGSNGDLESIDASGLSGDLDLGVVSNVSVENFAFTSGSGETQLTIGNSTLASGTLPNGDPAPASFDLSAAAADSTLTFATTTVFSDGALSVDTGDNATLRFDDNGSFDLSTLESVSISGTNAIEVGANTTLTLTAEQANGLNIVPEAGLAEDDMPTVNIVDLGENPVDLSGIDSDIAGNVTLEGADDFTNGPNNSGDDTVALDAATDLGDFKVELITGESVPAPGTDLGQNQTIGFATEEQANGVEVIVDDGNASPAGNANVAWLFDTLANAPVNTDDYSSAIARLFINDELANNNTDLESLWTDLSNIETVNIQFTGDLAADLNATGFDRTIEVQGFVEVANGVELLDSDPENFIQNLTFEAGGQTNIGDVVIDNFIGGDVNGDDDFNTLTLTSSLFADDPNGGLVNERFKPASWEEGDVTPDASVANVFGNLASGPDQELLKVVLNTQQVTVETGPAVTVNTLLETGSITFDGENDIHDEPTLEANGPGTITVTGDIDLTDSALTEETSSGSGVFENVFNINSDGDASTLEAPANSIVFGSDQAGTEAILNVDGTVGVTVKNVDTSDTNITSLTVDVEAGANFTATGGSEALSLTNVETINLGASGDITLGDEATSDPSFANAGDLTEINITGGSGDVALGTIQGFNSQNFTIDSGEGETTVTIGAAELNADPTATNPDQDGWLFDLSDADAGSEVNLTGDTVLTQGELEVKGSDVTIGISGDVDLSGIDLEVSTVQNFSVAEGATLTLTAEQADGLNMDVKGTVEITELEATPGADLSSITTSDDGAVNAALDSTGGVNLGGNLGVAAITVSGNGTVDATTPNNASFTVGTDATLALTAAQADGRMVDGAGTVNVSDLFDVDTDGMGGPDEATGNAAADLSGITADTVNAAVDTSGTFTGDLGQADVTVANSVILTADGDIVDGVTIDGEGGTVSVTGDATGADLSGLSVESINFATDATVDNVTFPTLTGDPTDASDDPDQKLTLTAVQAEGATISGASSGAEGIVTITNLGENPGGGTSANGANNSIDLSGISVGQSEVQVDGGGTITLDADTKLGDSDVAISNSTTLEMTGDQADGRTISDNGGSTLVINDVSAGVDLSNVNVANVQTNVSGGTADLSGVNGLTQIDIDDGANADLTLRADQFGALDAGDNPITGGAGDNDLAESDSLTVDVVRSESGTDFDVDLNVGFDSNGAITTVTGSAAGFVQARIDDDTDPVTNGAFENNILTAGVNVTQEELGNFLTQSTGAAGTDGDDTFEFIASPGGSVDITDFNAGGTDALDFTAFLDSLDTTTQNGGGNDGDAIAATQTVVTIDAGAAIVGKDYADGDFAELFSNGGTGFLDSANATAGANSENAIVIQGTDETQVFFVQNDGNDAIVADEVSLVGVLESNTTALTADNLAGIDTIA